LQETSGGNLARFMKLTITFIYGVLVLITFLILATVWHWQMSGAYFVSHKSLLVDFMPPFIQTGADGNFYIKPGRVIYAIWSVYIAIMFLAPAVFTWLLVRLHQRALNKSWL
jgi:hypothetical protein